MDIVSGGFEEQSSPRKAAFVGGLITIFVGLCVIHPGLGIMVIGGLVTVLAMVE